MMGDSTIDLEASIGLSRKWDAREAGREVARSTIKKLNKPPNFFLLFSTIHYKNHGGFDELLKGVWDVLPKNTPLIGGTIASFINNEGCFARGATALAISYPNMDVSISYAKNTKRNPKLAGKKCALILKNKLKDSPFENRFLINVVSGPIVRELPIFGKINVIKSKLIGYFFAHGIVRSLSFLGFGSGNEDEVLEGITTNLKDYHIVGGSAGDNGDFFSNYQFFGNQVLTNSIVALGGAIDLPISQKALTGLSQKNAKRCNVTRLACKNRIITRIEKRKAKDYFIKNLLGLSEEQLKDLGPFYYKFSYYFPFSLDETGKYSTGIGGIFGDNILLGHRIVNKNIAFHSVSGKEILDIIDTAYSKDYNYPFSLIFSSAIYSFILRNKTFNVKNKLDYYFDSRPYLVIQPTIENVAVPGEKAYVSTYGFNSLSIDTEVEAGR